MWKTFEYNGRQRVAYLASEGPAYQVSPVMGFRAFVKEQMKYLASADNMYAMIPESILERYPKLEDAKCQLKSQ